MSARSLVTLRDKLVERDIAILRSLRAHRIATTSQLRRLHFVDPFVTQAGATRAATRVLNRLEGLGLVTRLAQRIGGVRAGSTSLSWQLGATGDRFLGALDGDDRRRRYVEPGPGFLEHTLAVTELAVLLYEGARAGRFELTRLEAEPSCWRHFLGGHGRREILKPDLFAITTTGGYEDHWFLELDLGTEHPPVVVRKAQLYQRYAATEQHQAAHEVFPATLWIVPTTARQHALERAIAAAPGLQPALFRVIPSEGFVETISAGGDGSDDP